jgi:hypothetical protein
MPITPAEVRLNWHPIARRLGTPAELNRWEGRYDGIWGGSNFEDWWGTAYDSHPGRMAQALTARAIAGYLEEHRLLADSSGRTGRCGP